MSILPFGIFSERVPLHSGFELDAFQQREGVNVAEHWADDRNPVGQAGNRPETQSLDEICAHAVVHIAFKGTGAIDHHTETG